MFDTLYNTILPMLGQFFGSLATLATTSYGEVMDFLFVFNDSSTFISCVNVFTGAVFSLPSLNSGSFSGFLGLFISPIVGILKALGSLFHVNALPFVFGLLVMFVSSFLVFGVFKFFVHIIK